MSNLYRAIYSSRSNLKDADDQVYQNEIDQIIKTSRRNNLRDGVWQHAGAEGLGA